MQAVGSRLEELMQKDKINAENMVRLPSDELTRKQLRISDDLEDFLDEGIFSFLFFFKRRMYKKFNNFF